MGELILLGVVLVLGALAWWLFGDPDRSERLYKAVGPLTPLMWGVILSFQLLRDIDKKRWLGVLITLACMGFWVFFYRSERRKRRAA